MSEKIEDLKFLFTIAFVVFCGSGIDALLR